MAVLTANLLQLAIILTMAGVIFPEKYQHPEVTVGSTVKLRNKGYQMRLHSHDIAYGWGSHQQSVTGMTSATDANSYWQIRSPNNEYVERGSPIKCGQMIRLTHIRTGRNLHSHEIRSPMSMEQEVSCFGENGEGDHLDDWTVICTGNYWMRDDFVQFRHRETHAYLGTAGKTYLDRLNGQYEITSSRINPDSSSRFWKTMEGVMVRDFKEIGYR